MKKIYITLLIFIPLYSWAQIDYTPSSYYENPEVLFNIDTNMYLNEDQTCNSFYYEPNGNFRQTLKEEFIIKGNKIHSQRQILFNQSQITENIIKTFYESEKPIIHQIGFKVIGDSNIYAKEVDSFVYENGKIKYQYKFNEKLEFYYLKEFIHDPINGLKKTQIIQKNQSAVIYNLFEVMEFHKPNLPKTLYSYYDIKGDFDLDMIIHYTYDSLDRLIGTTDSILENGNIIPYETIKIVYIGSSRKIDTIYFDNTLFEYFSMAKYIYDDKGYVKTILDYEKLNDDEYQLDYRTELTKGITGLSNLESNHLNIKIFPNPTVDKIFIESKEPIQMVQVFDVKGQLLINKLEANIEQIDLNALQTGIYILKAFSENGYTQTRILKTQ